MLLLSFFTPVYELLLGANPDIPEYRQDIFAAVGMITFLISAALCALFYFALGKWKPIFYKRSHWFIVLTIMSFAGFYVAYIASSKELGSFDHYGFRFALINTVYAAIYFFILSILFKRGSIFAKRTPF